MKRYHVAIVGATGAVGQEFLGVLERHQFPLASVKLLASERSAGKQIEWNGQTHTVEAVTEDSFAGIDIALFSAGATRSRQFAPAAVRAGAVVVDNSSAFRMDPNTPLVVPEINAEELRNHQGIVANPNCSAIILLMAVAPLRKLSPIQRVVVSTYQASSGAGAAAMQELIDQSRAFLNGEPIVPKVFPHQAAFNVFNHNTAVGEDGYNEEEAKVLAESRKILGDPNLKLSATCVRVPVLRAHSEAVTIDFETRPTLEAVRAALEAFPGVKIVDDREKNYFPMPLDASGKEEVLVGRLRYDTSSDNGISLFVAGDQLLKGAALNAVQIAEKMIEMGLI